MSSMHSVKNARRRQHEEARDEPRAWVVVCIVVLGVAGVIALASLHMLPSFVADDVGSLLFRAG